MLERFNLAGVPVYQHSSLQNSQSIGIELLQTEDSMTTEPAKSCATCVFRIDAETPSPTALEALGTPQAPITVCAKLHATLALTPTMDDERAERIGSKCTHHLSAHHASSNALTDALTEHSLGGVYDWKIATAPVDDQGHEPRGVPLSAGASCTSCANYVPNSVVARNVGDPEEGGVPFPIQPYYCAARGTLHPTLAPQFTGAPLGCGEWVKPSGDVDRDVLISTASLFDHIREDLGLPDASRSVEPAAPEAERVPTDAEKQRGIVGFHRVRSDDGKRYVDLPVFDPNHFTPVERAKIPVAGDDAGPELFHDYANLSYRIAAAWALGETPALTGAPGLGKSQAAYYLAWTMQLPLERVSITSASQLDDLAGYTELVRSAEGNATEFVHGRIPQAWAKPCVLLLDEPNAGPPEVWQFLRPLTDAAKQLVLDVNHGERIARDEHSYLMMAMNPAWDYRNTGVTPLSDADGRRLVHITITAPEADVERKIIAAHLESDGQKLSEERIDVLVAIGQELRSLADSGPGSTGALQITWGLAQQVKVAKLLAYFEFAEAFRLAGADNLEPEQRDLILGVVNRLSSTEASPRKGRRRRGAQQVDVTYDNGASAGIVINNTTQGQNRAALQQAALQRAALRNSEPF
jgi:MoxR-like ATPase